MSLTNESDVKKMYLQHLQENIDLKKQVKGFDEAKARRVSEISQNQVDFFKKYSKYFNRNLKPFKLNGNNNNETLHRMGPLTRSNTDINLSNFAAFTKTKCCPPSPRKDSEAITKQVGIHSPMDYPYSLDTWQALLENGCKTSKGKPTLQSMKEKLIRAETPKRLEEKPSQNLITVENTSKLSSLNKLNKKSDNDASTSQREISVMSRNTRRHSISTSVIEDTLHKKANAINIKSNSLNDLKDDNSEYLEEKQNSGFKLPDISQKKVHFKNDIKLNDTNNINGMKFSNEEDDQAQSKRENIAPKHFLRQRSKSISWIGNSVKKEDGASFPSIMEEDESNFQCKSNIEKNNSMFLKPERRKSYSDVQALIRHGTGRKSMEKTALHVMMENSKGMKKFQYLAQMVNTELKEIQNSLNVETGDSKNEGKGQSNIDSVLACRYLRIPNQKDMYDF